jgi:intracellular multiplication protein IcmT
MWRATAFPVKLAVIDARACFPALLFVLHWSWMTLYIAIIGIVFFSTISFFGLTLPAITRMTRCWLVGSLRSGVPPWKRRRFA